MTTLVICNCGRLQEYDENLFLKCQHCEEEVMLPYDDKMEDNNEL